MCVQCPWSVDATFSVEEEVAVDKISPVSAEVPPEDVASEGRSAPPGLGEKHAERDPLESLVRELTNFVRNAIEDGRATSLRDPREPVPRDSQGLRELLECASRESRGLEQWKRELTEIASLAADIDISLRRARDSMAGLFDSVDEIASRACDAERWLRDAQDRIRALETT